MKFPDLPRSGQSVMDTVKQIINYLRSSRIISINGIKGTSSTNGTTFTIPIGDKNETSRDTRPPFWPSLITRDGGETFKFIITDGFVVMFKGGNGNTDALDLHFPTGIGTLGGDRTETSITVGQQISVVVSVDKEGDFYDAYLVVETENTNSTNPNPTTSGGTGAGGAYHFKIAVLRAATAEVPTHFEHYLAGDNLLVRHRGHNLDMHVFVVDISNGAIQPVSDHYLCWRNGDYVGKFESTDTRPGRVGTLDTSSSTRIQEYYP